MQLITNLIGKPVTITTVTAYEGARGYIAAITLTPAPEDKDITEMKFIIAVDTRPEKGSGCNDPYRAILVTCWIHNFVLV